MVATTTLNMQQSVSIALIGANDRQKKTNATKVFARSNNQKIHFDESTSFFLLLLQEAQTILLFIW